MLKSICYSILVLTFSHSLFANVASELPIPCASVVVNSQTQLDNLSLTGCTMIAGDVEIHTTNPTDPITDLSDFLNVTEITGNLHITNNTALLTLNGLNQLMKVGGQVLIANNAALQHFSDLTLLERIEQDFILDSNMSLKGNSMAHNLKYIGNLFKIALNDSLLSPPSLPQLDTILGELIIEQNPQLNQIIDYSDLKVLGGVSITQNPLLITISGFSNLPLNNGDININVNSSLMNITAFQNLQNQYGDIIISQNSVMTSVVGFFSLTKMSGEFNVYGNSNLTTFNAFTSLDSIMDNATIALGNVTDFSSISNIDYVDGRFAIEDNAALLNTDFLLGLRFASEIIIKRNPNLITITEPNTNPFETELIDIDGNISLTSIQGFSNITELVELDIAENVSLSSINAFNQLESVEEMTIVENENLVSIGGFLNLESAEQFYIRENPRLQEISEFNNDDFFVEYLEIYDNDSLTSITGFQNAYQIIELAIEDNDLLIDLFGFNNLTVCEDVGIQYNESLEEFCPFYNLIANQGEDVNFDADGNDEDPSASDIFGQGSCYLFEIDEALYLTLKDATLAAMANDTIRYIPRNDDDYDVHETDDEILIPANVVVIGNAYLVFDINGTVIIEGTLITEFEAQFYFRNGMILNGSIINQDLGEILVQEEATINGTIINKDESKFITDTAPSKFTVINGTITNGINARLDLSKCRLNGAIDNYGQLSFEN